VDEGKLLGSKFILEADHHSYMDFAILQMQGFKIYGLRHTHFTPSNKSPKTRVPNFPVVLPFPPVFDGVDQKLFGFKFNLDHRPSILHGFCYLKTDWV
jgi:hypothetical protein